MEQKKVKKRGRPFPTAEEREINELLKAASVEAASHLYARLTSAETPAHVKDKIAMRLVEPALNKMMAEEQANNGSLNRLMEILAK